MKSEFHKGKTDLYAKGLMAATVLLGGLTFLRVVGFLSAASEAQVMAAKMDPNEEAAPDDMSKLLASSKASAEELKKKNLFIATPPREHPVKEVLGILGDEALIGDRWCKVGDSVGDAKIVAIEPTKVKIAWDGKETEFSPIGAEGTGGGGDNGRPDRTGRRQVSAGNAQVVVTGGRRGGMRGGQGLSPQEREQMRQRWQNMSPEERQRAREEMRQRLGARPR